MHIVDREQVEKAIVQGIEKANLRPFQKMRLRNIFERNTRPRLKEDIIDKMILDMEENGDIVESPDGVAYAMDWASFFDLVLKYLPLILKLFGL